MSRVSLFSDSWYRVSALKPRLRQHVRIHRRLYRNKVWYLLQDHVTGKFHRFTPDAYYIIQLMNGSRSVEEIWQLACRSLDDDKVPSQDELIQLISRLHNADVILGGSRPDSGEMLDRQRKVRKSKLFSYFLNPLGMRFPLLDPESWLQHMQGFSRVMFHPLTGVMWLLLVGSALFMAIGHWDTLTLNVSDRILSKENLVLIWIIYPFVKFLHEMGHALAVKRWGGEVHEMGIMLMVLVPIPYVDASDAHAFRNKSQRIVVGLIGMGVEVALAALAMWFWLSAEEGVARSIAFNVMLIAGVSTLLFNLNPLLRFDGYHVFSDLLEIPNLGQRANKYIGYLLKKYIFAAKNLSPFEASPRERAWLFFYAITSFVYRMVVLYIIVLFIAGKYFLVGLLLASWAVFMMLFVPVFKVIKTALIDPELHTARTRGFSLISAFFAVVLAVLLAIPVSSSTLAEGVIWIPESMWLRAGSNAFVKEIVVPANTYVHKGDVLIRTEEPELHVRLKVIRSGLNELNIRLTRVVNNDRVQARLLEEQIAESEAEESYLISAINDLTIRSPADGIFMIHNPGELLGRFVQRGQLMAYVVQPESVYVRAVVTQEDVKKVRENTQNVQLRMINSFAKLLDGRILREVPSAGHDLPSMALAVEGGGEISLDPASKDKPKAFNSLFQFDIALPATISRDFMGSRVYVRFEHYDEPLALQWYHSLRQTFLSVLNV